MFQGQNSVPGVLTLRVTNNPSSDMYKNWSTVPPTANNGNVKQNKKQCFLIPWIRNM